MSPSSKLGDKKSVLSQILECFYDRAKKKTFTQKTDLGFVFYVISMPEYGKLTE